MVKQQEIDLAEESSTSSPATKYNKDDNTDEDKKLKIKRGEDQNDASGQESDDLKQQQLHKNGRPYDQGS